VRSTDNENVVERNLPANNCDLDFFYYGDCDGNVYFLASASMCVFVVFLVFHVFFRYHSSLFCVFFRYYSINGFFNIYSFDCFFIYRQQNNRPSCSDRPAIVFRRLTVDWLFHTLNIRSLIPEDHAELTSPLPLKDYRSRDITCGQRVGVYACR